MNGKQPKVKALPQFNGLKRTSIDLASLLGVERDDNNNYADWAEVDAGVIHNIVWAISEMGGTAQFGRTKNSKAYTLKLYVGTPYPPQYFDGNAEGRAALANLAQALVEAVAGGA